MERQRRKDEKEEEADDAKKSYNDVSNRGEESVREKCFKRLPTHTFTLEHCRRGKRRQIACT